MTFYLFGVTLKVFLVRLIVADIVIQTLLKGMESLHISLGCLLSLNFYWIEYFCTHLIILGWQAAAVMVARRG